EDPKSPGSLILRKLWDGRDKKYGGLFTNNLMNDDKDDADDSKRSKPIPLTRSICRPGQWWFDGKYIKQIREVSVPLNSEDRDAYQAILDQLNEEVIAKKDFTKTVYDFWPEYHWDNLDAAQLRMRVHSDLHNHPEWSKIAVLMTRFRKTQLMDEEYPILNRLLLEASYPEEIRSQHVV